MTASIFQEIERRVPVLDGAMGTMIQRLHLSPDSFHGSQFAEWPCSLEGNNDILCLTAPEAILSIHKEYIAAGADIISTNSFNANAISQADYRMESQVARINEAAAAIALRAAKEAAATGHKVWVAGSVGPTNRSASMSPDVENPAARNVTYGELRNAYHDQISALARGGVDFILAETVFDTLNLKALLAAAKDVAAEQGRELPVMVSATISDRSGRILSGQTIEAFLATVAEYDNVLSVGLNCSMGPADIVPHLRRLAAKASFPVSCHPNAGLPDELGRYRETPEAFAHAVAPLLDEGLVNIIGGCCGTTPEHIARLKETATGRAPRVIHAPDETLRLTGLEAIEVRPENNFLNIGERCNVAGSRRFLRLIKEKNYEEAARIAARQVESGAQMVDINMDDALLDAPAEMEHFLNLIASDPEVARVPVMIDSSNWEVVERALQCVQGKCVVNSISLKEGEEEFLRKAAVIRSFGAAVVVMAFDEQGQADTYQRKIEICQRAYRLLTHRAGFKPHNIIFDPNIMAVATGIPEHDLYARDFLQAVSWIKANLPGAKVSGGVSNLSFAFRGHNALRESMHAVFLYHAANRGMDMGIVNPDSSVTYSDIAPALRDDIEALLLKGDHESAERLGAYALEQSEAKKDAGATQSDKLDDNRLSLTPEQRLNEAIVKGRSEHLETDLLEALSLYDSPVAIIEGPLMEAIGHVGEMFGQGKMFLPQVVRASRVMKQAVSILRPYIEASSQASGATKAGRILFATVKGDVHDIGKNIVSIVLECNNYEVIDLGVMVPAEQIVEAARTRCPDLICLSGLITASLGEMAHTARELARAGIRVPLVVGGATTSKLHTALRIAPEYGDAPVIHATDAAQNPIIAARVLNNATRADYIANLRKEYASLRDAHYPVPLLSLPQARQRRYASPAYSITAPATPGLNKFHSIPLSELIPLINWRPFFHAWKLAGDFADNPPHCMDAACCNAWLAQHGTNPDKAREALKLYADAYEMLNQMAQSGQPVMQGCVTIVPARSDGDDIVIADSLRLPMLRQQKVSTDAPALCLADYVAPVGANDHIAISLATTGAATRELIDSCESVTDTYRSLLARTLADRLAEAAAEYLHRLTRTQLWRFAPDEALTPAQLRQGEYQGIRPAIGYPMIPDQSLLCLLAPLLPFSEFDVKATDNGAMDPPATVCSLILANPHARYFMVGPIADDQFRDYALRRNLPESDLRRLLARHLS